MKILTTIIFISGFIFMIAACSNAKKQVIAPIENKSEKIDSLVTVKNTDTASIYKISYTKDVRPLVMEYCGPCHTGGRNSDLHIYEECKDMNEDNIIRMRLPVDDDEFMPVRRAPLSDSLINIFVQWGKDGYIK